MPGKIRPLSSAELHVIAEELQAIVSSHFKNFYELREGSFLIAFSKERRETDVYVNLANTVNITEFREKVGAPTEFALAVRKRLDGSRVESVEQHGTDRILVIRFSGKEERRMVIEMFNKGNLLLVSKDGIIEQAYSSRDFKERSVRRSMLYSFPEQKGRATHEAESERLESMKEKGFKTLSQLMDSLFAEERSAAAVNPEKNREVEELRKSVEKLRRQIDEMRANGEQYKRIANRIFERMREVNELLEQARKSKARRAEELTPSAGIAVKRVDAKKKTVTVEMD